MSDPDGAQRRSLFQLIGELPGLVSELIRAEIDAIKADVKDKAIRAGVGVGLLLVALFLLLSAFAVGIFAAIAGIATVLPMWASALIVLGALLVIAIALGLAAMGSFKSMKGSTRIASITEDVQSLGSGARRAARERGEGPNG